MTTQAKATIASVVHAVLCAIAGALLFYLLLPVPTPAVEYQIIHVSRAAFEKHEPDTKVGVLEGIARPRAKLVQRVVADSAATDMVEEFMAAVRASEAARDELLVPENKNTANPLPPRPIPPRLAFAYAGDQTSARLHLFTATSDLAKERLTYNVCGHVTWRMDGDSAVVQGSRLCWLPDALGIGGAGILGYGIAERDPYAIGGGVLLLVARKVLQR